MVTANQASRQVQNDGARRGRGSLASREADRSLHPRWAQFRIGLGGVPCSTPPHRGPLSADVVRLEHNLVAGFAWHFSVDMYDLHIFADLIGSYVAY